MLHTAINPVPSEKLLGPGFGPGVWPLRERLALATALLDVDNRQASWQCIARRLSRFTPLTGRPRDWCSARACAKQYALLLDSAELTRRQKWPTEAQLSRLHILNPKVATHAAGPGSGLSVTERLVKRLTAERVEELRERIKMGQKFYSFLKTTLSELEQGLHSSQAEQLCRHLGIVQPTDMGDPNLTNPPPDNESTQPDPWVAEFIQQWSQMETFYTIPENTWVCPPGPGFSKQAKLSSSAGSSSRLVALLDEASAAFRSSKSSVARTPRRWQIPYNSLQDNKSLTARAAVATRQRYLTNNARNRMGKRGRPRGSRSNVFRNEPPSRLLRMQPLKKTSSRHQRIDFWYLSASRDSPVSSTGASTPSTAAMFSSDTEEYAASFVVSQTDEQTTEGAGETSDQEPGTPAESSQSTEAAASVDADSALTNEVITDVHTSGAQEMADVTSLSSLVANELSPPDKKFASVRSHISPNSINEEVQVTDTLAAGSPKAVMSGALPVGETSVTPSCSTSPKKVTLKLRSLSLHNTKSISTHNESVDQASSLGFPSGKDEATIATPAKHSTPVPVCCPTTPQSAQPLGDSKEELTVMSDPETVSITDHSMAVASLTNTKQSTSNCSLANDRTQSSTERPPPVLPSDLEVAIELSPCLEADYRIFIEDSGKQQSDDVAGSCGTADNDVDDAEGNRKRSRRKARRKGKPRGQKSQSDDNKRQSNLSTSSSTNLPTTDSAELQLLDLKAAPTPLVSLEPIKFSPIDTRIKICSSPEPDQSNTPPVSSRSLPVSPDQSGLKLRLSRKGSRLAIVSVLSDSPCDTPPLDSDALRSSNSASTQSTPSGADWVNWSSSVLGNCRSAMATVVATLNSVSKSPASDKRGLESVRSAFDTIEQELRSGSIHSRPQFVHRLLAQLAQLTMANSCQSSAFRVVQFVYRNVQALLTTRLID